MSGIRNIKLVLLIYLLSLLSANVFAGNTDIARLATFLEYESGKLHNRLRGWLGSESRQSRDAHSLYYLVQDFSRHCYDSINSGLDTGQQLSYKFMKVHNAFNNLQYSMHAESRLYQSLRLRRDMRRIESRFYTLKNSLHRIEQASNIYSSDNVEPEPKDY